MTAAYRRAEIRGDCYRIYGVCMGCFIWMAFLFRAVSQHLSGRGVLSLVVLFLLIVLFYPGPETIDIKEKRHLHWDLCIDL